MEKVKQVGGFLYRHSFVRYVLIGGTTFAIDFFLLVLLHGVLNVNVIVAATISYWTSIAFNFVANRFWTFGATETHIAKHAASYGMLLGFNYLFTIGFIAGATHLGMHYTIAKVISVAIQMAWTYLAYKKLIFK
ncbi:MAG TPA: GtrA family protein [Candidatus Saccharimonadales bacterium]|nr:GtrA family protein [Candidatus Saccharimonadales bacterium]